jgi:hypothetical protein
VPRNRHAPVKFLDPTAEHLVLALEASDAFGVGGVALAGWVEVCDHLLEAFEAGSHVAINAAVRTASTSATLAGVRTLPDP